MGVLGYLKGQVRRRRALAERAEVLGRSYPAAIDRSEWAGSLTDPSGFYDRMHHFFNVHAPTWLREHRAYFTQERRGFGEDAFHVMWYLLFNEFRPRQVLEIGIYRGQVLSLAGLLQRELGIVDGEVTGISPFTSAGDAVSKYIELDYMADTLKNVEHFGLPKPNLLRAYSTDAEAVALIRSKAWDCIYIDGGHDYEVVKQDWETCSQAVRVGGLIVMDDASRNLAYAPRAFATAGHPGPSRAADEIDQSKFREILRVGHNRVFQRL